MSSIKTNPSGTFQLVVRNKLLPEPFYWTFNSREEAAKYGNTLEGWLKQGVVPQALIKRKSDDKASWPISRCIIDHVKTVGIPDST